MMLIPQETVDAESALIDTALVDAVAIRPAYAMMMRLMTVGANTADTAFTLMADGPRDVIQASAETVALAFTKNVATAIECHGVPSSGGETIAIALRAGDAFRDRMAALLSQPSQPGGLA